MWRREKSGLFARMQDTTIIPRTKINPPRLCKSLKQSKSVTIKEGMLLFSLLWGRDRILPP
jgi:hypothetical protein